MITPEQKKSIEKLAPYADQISWNRADRKAFRWLWYLYSVATGHTWNEQEKIRLRQLKRKYIVNNLSPQKDTD